MEEITLQFLANSHLPFLNRRVQIIRYFLRRKGWQNYSEDRTPIEIVIPCGERDLEILPIVVKNIHKFLLHPIQRIWIIGAFNHHLSCICRELNCTFINEDTVLPIDFADIGDYSCQGLDRRGWLFQQLLKLGADSFVQTDYYYVLDADTVLISPQVLLKNNKIILNISDEFHQPYRVAYKHLLGEDPISPISFVSHQMLFEKETLKQLKEKIESHTKLHWYQAIIDRIDRTETSSFSEYETYGNFLLKYHLDKVQLEYFFNTSLDRTIMNDFARIESQYKGIYKSLSCHWHTKPKSNTSLTQVHD